MSNQGTLDQLLLRWQELQKDLQSISAEELCEHSPELVPELRRRIELLRQMEESLSGSPEGPTRARHTVRPEVVPTGLSSDSVEQVSTVDQPAGTVVPPSSIPEVDGYRIAKVLGRGGMGVVYEAFHLGLKRTVALKMILSGGHAGDAQLQRFRLEAQAVAQLKHANIVQIYEVGDQKGLPFFSLEFCGEGALADKLDGTPWENQAAAQIMETLARGMHAAHQAGIIHRDLKPHNVLLDADGTPKITDFGLAKNLGEEDGITNPGSVMGTPSYMAPEQAQGKIEELGAAVDVYSLGAILYQLLTGRPPFKAASSWDTIAQVIHNEPVAPRQLNPKASRDLETICLKCLEKGAPKRYGSAEALAEELRRVQAGEPILARPIGSAERSVKWAKRNPLVASLLALILLVLAAGATVSTVLAVLASRRADDANTAKGAATLQAEKAKKSEISARESETKALAAAAKLRKLNDELLTSIATSMGRSLGQGVRANQPLSDPEKKALGELEGITQEELRVRFLLEALKDPVTTGQFRTRAEPTLQAVVGLNLSRREEVDRLLSELLVREGVPESQRNDAALIAVQLGDPSPRLARLVATRLAKNLERARESSQQVTLSENLCSIADQMDPKEAGPIYLQTASILANAQSRTRDRYAQKVLSEGLVSVVKRMEGEEAVQTTAFLARAMSSTTEKPTLASLSQSLSEVVDRLESDKKLLVVAHLARAMGNTQRSDSLQSLSQSLASLVARLAPKEAARAVTPVIDTMSQTKHPPAVQYLAQNLVSLADRMEPSDATKVCSQVLTNLAEVMAKSETSYQALRYLLPALNSLVNRVAPKRRRRQPTPYSGA